MLVSSSQLYNMMQCLNPVSFGTSEQLLVRLTK